MTLPTADTIVHYPAGGVTNTASVIHVEKLEGSRVAVLLDATSCHPVDAGWPDQGSDRAVLRMGDTAAPVLESVVAATDGQALFLGGDIPVGKGTEGWAFVVAHIVASASAPVEGDRVQTEVDAGYRHRLSAGHTACHLAALALNKAVASRWRKQVRIDGLGSPDFDAAANDTSLIGECGSLDTYRLGKSLRKKGFVAEGFDEELDSLQACVNQRLAEWIETAAPVHIECEGERLSDRRYWVCELPENTVRIACGGTHLESLSEFGTLRAQLSVADVAGTTVLRMETEASRP